MINKVILHCSDSPQGRGDTAETIHRWHKERGFDGIGYHHVILEDGIIEQGRPEYWSGAHCKGNNTGSVGICLVGIDSFTSAQYNSLDKLVAEYEECYPNVSVYGHYQLDSSKSCPNFDVVEWLKNRGSECYKD